MDPQIRLFPHMLPRTLHHPGLALPEEFGSVCGSSEILRLETRIENLKRVSPHNSNRWRWISSCNGNDVYYISCNDPQAVVYARE